MGRDIVNMEAEYRDLHERIYEYGSESEEESEKDELQHRRVSFYRELYVYHLGRASLRNRMRIVRPRGVLYQERG